MRIFTEQKQIITEQVDMLFNHKGCIYCWCLKNSIKCYKVYTRLPVSDVHHMYILSPIKDYNWHGVNRNLAYTCTYLHS